MTWREPTQPITNRRTMNRLRRGMIFFDYIYISGYRAYKRYDSKQSDPRFHAVLLVCVCMLSLLSLGIGIVMTLVDTDAFFRVVFKIFGLILVAFVVWMYLVYYYYSPKRTERILAKFERKPLFIRVLWGWIAALTVIAP